MAATASTISAIEAATMLSATKLERTRIRFAAFLAAYVPELLDVIEVIEVPACHFVDEVRCYVRTLDSARL